MTAGLQWKAHSPENQCTFDNGQLTNYIVFFTSIFSILISQF